MIIDAHCHLWLKQDGRVNGRPVYSIGGGRSDFGGEIRQMLPPYMTDGSNTAELLLSNMDFAGVNCAVVTQEYIDGCQNDYLRGISERFDGRIKACSLYSEEMRDDEIETDGFDGIKICAGRLSDGDLSNHARVFELAAKSGRFISIDLAEGDSQCGALAEISDSYPSLRIAIGHFGMVGRDGWREQIKLARRANIYIESGGITWLYNSEFYPYPSAVRAIREAAELVGYDKLMWGSDYPRTMTAITYAMSLDFVKDSREIAEADKSRFLGENARRFYGFDEMPDIARIKHMAED